MNKLALFLFFSISSLIAAAQGPKILVITAHPDDETTFSVSLFKITKELKGTVDMAVMTDGGGGFADSQLGALYFDLPITDSTMARTHLPMIRKQEIISAAKIMGIRNIILWNSPMIFIQPILNLILLERTGISLM